MQTAISDGRIEPNGLDRDEAESPLPTTLDIELDPPIEKNGTTYTTLHFEEPTGKQVERAETELTAGGTQPSLHHLRRYQFALLSLCAGVPRSVIEEMRISQIEEAALFLASFSNAGPRTGATRSPT